MTIYNFNEVSGGSTPVEVEVSNLKIGDIIITNRENVAEYEAEGVDLFKLTYYNQIVNAADYPKIAELTDYNYNASIVSTSPLSDNSITVVSGIRYAYIKDTDNTFIIIPGNSTNTYRINADNTTILLSNATPSIDIYNFRAVNFDNFNKILIIYKSAASATTILATIFDKITNTFSTPITLHSGVASGSNCIAARLMPDGLIYIVNMTSVGNIVILRTLDGVVFETLFTNTLTHYSLVINNICFSDEKGSLNIDDNYDFYYTQNNTSTLRSLNKINLLDNIKFTNLTTYAITSGLVSYMAVNLKNNQIILYKNFSSQILDFVIYNIEESTVNNYSITLNDNLQPTNLLLVDYNNLFIFKNTFKDLVYTNDFVNFTKYNYSQISFTVLSNNNFSIDFRFNDSLNLIYNNTSGGQILKRNITVNKVADTLLLPKAPFSNYQADSYLITDIIEGV
jgi:hypothetical protein